MSTSGPSASAHLKSVPCRFYNQGYCRFGEKCRYSHGSDVKHDAHTDQRRQTQPSSSSGAGLESSDARPRPQRGETPCHAWKAGTCIKGSKCRFSHDVEKSGIEPSRSYKQGPSLHPTEEDVVSLATALSRTKRDERKAERVRAQEVEAAAARERAAVIAREEAAKTITQVVCGSIVTYSAGLDVPHLITGFETCTLRVRNLAFDVKEDDIRFLLRRQGLDDARFHIVIKKGSDRRPEAHITTDVATGQELNRDLDGVEFQDEILVVEMSATNSLEGMNAASGQCSEVLTISWRAPSVRYVAEYIDIAAANGKVKELDRLVYRGRRIKVEMNTQPRGRHVPNLRLNAVRISNLPANVTDEDVVGFSGALSTKRLQTGGAFGITYTVERIAELVRDEIQRAVPGGLKKFDDPPSTCNMEGVVSARAHFSSWDEAHTAHTRLSDKRYGNQPIWLRLPDPMYFTLVIPVEQYKAQKAQWDSLSSSIKDKKACTLNVRETGNIVRVQLSGSVKEATGALKVRVENLARGEKVEGWHRLLGFSASPFVPRVYSETGAFLRADWRQRSLKVYGSPSAVDRAREMIKNELERLASLDHVVTLAQHSVGFFVREGIQQLKETLGEDNVKFTMSSRKLIVSGGEEARHAVDRLITLSHRANPDPSKATQGGQTCPICYDSISSPHQLSCGHAYCIACLRHFITSALESDQLPLTCLGDEAQCGVPVAIPTIQQFLPPASFNRLLEAAFDAYIAKHPDEFKPCKTPDCTQIYRAARAGVALKTLHCPSCFSAICNGCHEDAHDGLSCAESKARRDPAEVERLNDAWIASQGGRVKKCPRCDVMIEKLEGCNHMSCRCGAHICWRCMGVFTAETIYAHMHTAHGTIHDDVPAVPRPPEFLGIAVDIDEQRELLRQAEMRRANAAMWDYGYGYGFGIANQARERQREEEERRERLARYQREREEMERRVREQRLREAEARRREVEEQERRARALRAAEERRKRENSGGWGCTVM